MLYILAAFAATAWPNQCKAQVAQNLAGQSSQGFATFGQSDLLRAVVEVNGIKCNGVIDTGCSLIVIDPKSPAITKLSKSGERRVRGVNNDVVSEVYTNCKVGWGNRMPSNFDVDALSLFFFYRLTGIESDVVLGTPALKDMVITFDQREGKVFIDQPKVTPFSRTVTLEMYEEMPYLRDVEIGRNGTKFLLDTGSVSTLEINADLFQALVEEREINGVRESLQIDAGGELPCRTGYIDKLSLFGFELFNVPVIESSRFAIGIELLRKFNFTISIKDLSLTVEATEETATPFRRNQSGLAIDANDQKIQVLRVRPGSPGDIAGVRVGDVILSVNGLRVFDCNLLGVRELFCTLEEAPVTLSLRRNESRVSAFLKRSSINEP